MTWFHFVLVAVICVLVGVHTSAQGQVVPLGLHGSPEYVDLVKTPRWSSVDGSSLTYDQEGWPQQDFEWILDHRRNKPWDGPDFSGSNDNITGVYKMSFSGQACLSGAGSDSPFAIQFVNQTYDSSTQTTTVDVVVLPAHFLLVISFTNTSRPGQGNNTGLTNIKLYQPGYTLDKPQLFTDEFIDLVVKLKSATFRSFDTGINGYPIWSGADLVNNTWATRSLPTDPYWPLASRNQGNISGLAMPWEIYMQICLQTNTPGWFNLPIGADDEYVTNFALLLKNGNNYTKPLNPDLPFYIEHSNEVWNWGFSQSIYNEVKAKQNNVSTIQNYVQRVFQISNIFRTVFGDKAMGTTVRIVCMWQYSTWTDIHQTLLWAQQLFGGTVNDYIWGIGEAPYVDPIEGGHVPYSSLDPNGVDRIIDSMYTSAGVRRQAFAAWQAVATYFGIHVVGYESGPSLGAGIEGEASRSPRMEDFEYRYFMENYFATGAQTANFFALGPSGPGTYGDWYLFEHWGQYDFGKLQGYLAVSGQPYPAITVGYVLPWYADQSVEIDSSQYDCNQRPGSRVSVCTGGCWPNPPNINYLLRATATGEHQITIYGSSQPGAALVVSLDNVPIKTASLPQNGNITIPVQISSLGFHTLSLSGSGTGPTYLLQGGGIIISLTSGKGNLVVPSAPLNVLVTSTNMGANLLWEKVTTATTYTVQRSTASGGPYINVGSSPNNSYVDSGLQNDVMYYYVVTAQNAAGNSALSPQVQVIPVQNIVPAAPSVSISSGMQNGGSPLGGLGQVYLKWNPVPNAQSYKIIRWDSTGKPSTLSTQLGTFYYDESLTPGSSYSYNISAANAIGSSLAVSVSTTIPSTSVPGAPTALTVNATNGFAYLQWNQAIWTFPEFGELFVVEKAATSSGPWTAWLSISVNNCADFIGTACYRVWGSSSKGGNSPQPSNVVCAQ